MRGVALERGAFGQTCTHNCCDGPNFPCLPAELWEHVFEFVAVQSRLAVTGRRLDIYEFQL
jgi:hypothetical protein